jgi:aminoglycoside phosphotransferase
LRDSGRSYAAVARSLGFKRAVDARAAFLRALHQRQGEERTSLIQRESARLDKLETRIRTRDADDPEKMERRLVALAKMREGLG